MTTLEGVDLSTPPKVEEQVEKKVEEKKDTPEKEKTLFDYLSEHEGSPDEVRVEQWKQEYGEILCSGLSETELYIFRPVARAEFVNLQAHLTQIQDKPNNFEVEKLIVDTCVLWASPQGLASLEQKAGTLTTLHEQILQASNFMNPAYVGQFVVKL